MDAAKHAVYDVGDTVVHSDYGICGVVAVLRGRLIRIRSLAIGHRQRRHWVDLSVDAGKVKLYVGPASKDTHDTSLAEDIYSHKLVALKDALTNEEHAGNMDYDCSDTDIEEDAILASTQHKNRRNRRKTSAANTATNVWGSFV